MAVEYYLTFYDLPFGYYGIAFDCFGIMEDVVLLKSDIAQWCDENNIEYRTEISHPLFNGYKFEVVLQEYEAVVAFKLRWA